MMPPISHNGSDEFQTPPEALEPLMPYLPPDWTLLGASLREGLSRASSSPGGSQGD